MSIFILKFYVLQVITHNKYPLFFTKIISPQFQRSTMCYANLQKNNLFNPVLVKECIIHINIIFPFIEQPSIMIFKYLSKCFHKLFVERIVYFAKVMI